MPEILLVDDEPLILEATARSLREAGYRVAVASDGQEAWTVIENDPTIRCLVTDILMPRMNGIELAARLASSHPAIPVILVSGYGAAALQSRGMTPPCGVLQKPFGPEVLVKEIERCLEGHSDLEDRRE